MKIGVIGMGVVGSAISNGFCNLGHTVIPHDIKLETDISDVLESHICYICVPTPSKKDGSCDTTIVSSVYRQLLGAGYEGIIAIKSTVPPGTTERMIANCSIEFDRKLSTCTCVVPEFLRERCAADDFMNNHDVCVIGTEYSRMFNAIKLSHGHYPKQFVRLGVTEAELCKYFNNTYNAMLVTFANSFYEICKSMGESYARVKDAVIHREHIFDRYLDCDEDFRGFGGVCLPKDTKAMSRLCKERGLNVKFFESLLIENEKYKTTVIDGMRDE